jgi:hypothetical protein
MVNLNKDCIKRELEIQKSMKALEPHARMSSNVSQTKLLLMNDKNHNSPVKGLTQQVSLKKVDSIMGNVRINGEDSGIVTEAK